MSLKSRARSLAAATVAASLASLAASLVGAAALPAQTAAPKTVAILYFDNNTGRADYDPLGRGISAMLTTDLATVPEIRLVERERLDAVMSEQRLQGSPMFDPATAVRTGKLLGAQYLLTGSVSAVDPQMRIDTRVISVETGEVVRTAKVQGKSDDFFKLQQRLASELVDGLPVAVSPEAREALRQQQLRNQIDDARTVVELSQGFALLGGRDYVGAAEKLAPASRRSPNALVVRAAYDEAKRHAGSAVKEKAKAGLRGLLKRP